METLKELTAFCIRFSGLPWLIRNWLFRDSFAIVVFHNPSAQSLKKHLAYLSRHYQLINLQTFVTAIETKRTNELPAKSMILTIDDGHAGNYHLLQLFRQYQVRPTIYLCSHLIDTQRSFRAKMTPLTYLKIRKMAPWCDFQSHGKFHLNLTICDDDTALEEVAGSKKAVEKMLGKKCEHFAYPFGDYSNREADYVKKCGYKSGRTTDPGWNDAASDPYRLKIVAMIPDHASRNMLCAQLTGLPHLMEYFIQRVVKALRAISNRNYAKKQPCPVLKLKNKINVLIVIDHGGYHGKMAGIGRSLAYILPHIDKTQFKIVLAILRDDGSLIQKLQKTGVKIFLLNRKKLDPRTIGDLVRIIKKEKIDLLHLYQYASSNFGRIAGKITGIPTILNADDTNYEYPWYQWIADRILKIPTDRVIAVSESVKDACCKIRGINPAKISVIPNAVSQDSLIQLDNQNRIEFKKKLGIQDGHHIVGTVTRLHPVKGNDVLLRAASHVLRQIPNTYFIIVGDGPLLNSLISTAKKTAYTDRILFCGYQENVSAFLSIFDVMVIASSTEGFSLALLEAMIMGKAVVATNMGGTGEILKDKHNGLLIPPQDPVVMAEKIVYLLRHEEERQRLGSKAQEICESYSIKRHVRMRENLYAEMADNRK
jgi:glycosyltransferase involved in cell wall biosynthesis/peptidoglycan/xylan/chitin deacetylase (PgdA/CDA1 family)